MERDHHRGDWKHDRDDDDSKHNDSTRRKHDREHSNGKHDSDHADWKHDASMVTGRTSASITRMGSVTTRGDGTRSGPRRLEPRRKRSDWKHDRHRAEWKHDAALPQGAVRSSERSHKIDRPDASNGRIARAARRPRPPPALSGAARGEHKAVEVDSALACVLSRERARRRAGGHHLGGGLHFSEGSYGTSDSQHSPRSSYRPV